MGKLGKEKGGDSPGEELIAVGRVLAPWGVRGMLKVEVLTDFAERFAPGQKLLLKGRQTIVEESERRGGRFLLKLQGIDDPQSASEFSDHLLEVHQRDTFPLPPGQYYRFQIQGLEVWTVSGEHLGRIDDILVTGSNDVYVVHGPRGESLIPAIEDVITEVDLEQGRLTIQPFDGLLPPSPGKEPSPGNLESAIEES